MISLFMLNQMSAAASLRYSLRALIGGKLRLVMLIWMVMEMAIVVGMRMAMVMEMAMVIGMVMLMVMVFCGVSRSI